MNKHYAVGIDVSHEWLDVERAEGGVGKIERARFDNNAGGHRKLSRWLHKGGRQARVVLEATGPYHVGVATVLAETKGIEVMVANPMVISSFRKSLLQRASTDESSASALREFAQRMEFVRWTPPPKERMELRAISRRLEALTKMKTEEKNRLHAARVAGEPPAVLKDIRAHILALSKRQGSLRAEALRVISKAKDLQESFSLLCTIKGVGQVSGTTILAELANLSTELDARQWVAYAGLDPRPIESGTSVKQPTRISKIGNVHLRSALYMPALTAMRFNLPVRAFAAHLRAKGKAELVIIVAVMRKMLHAIYGMLKHRTAFEGDKFYRQPLASVA